MARTTSDAVNAIIETDGTTSLVPFIEAASELVTEHCAAPGTLTDERLAMIETWLAAHFYAIRDMRAASEKAGPAGASYQYEVGLVLANTMYGQQAMLLDSTGGLAVLSKSCEEGKPKFKPQLRWLGRRSTVVE